LADLFIVTATIDGHYLFIVTATMFDDCKHLFIVTWLAGSSHKILKVDILSIIQAHFRWNWIYGFRKYFQLLEWYKYITL